jgi:hypothetical protein
MTSVLISAISAFLSAHRALPKYVLSQMNRGLLEESQDPALIERATARLTTRFSASETDVLRER